MADSYLTISLIAADASMQQRVTSCAAQQGVKDDPYRWAADRRYEWAASPGWAEAWDYALATHPADPEAPAEQPPYSPGADPAVITDAQILAAVQPMAQAPGQ